MTAPPDFREYAVRLGSGSTLMTFGGNVRDALGEAGVLREAVRWVRVRPTCDFCDAVAVRYDRNAADETPLCKAHAVEHYGGTVRSAYRRTGELGVTRFCRVHRVEWAEREGV